MAVTKSWIEAVAVQPQVAVKVKLRERRREFWWLLGASLFVALGLVSVFVAKTQDFPASEDRLNRGELVNLNQLANPDGLNPALLFISDPGARELVATRMYDYVQQHRPLPNVGALALLHVTSAEIENEPRLAFLKPSDARAKTMSRFPLVPLSKIKGLLAVRTPREFQKTFIRTILAYLAAFWFVHLFWRLRRFRGDPAILPALQLLSGIGLILMISLRDPLRDTLEFKKFAEGVMLGCALLLLPLFRGFQYRRFSRWIYTPLFAALALFLALTALGSGPTGSDAKVNLGPFQPVEAIKILLALFMAGYFTHNWERLRDLREKRLVPRWLRWLELPKIEHAFPVMIGVSCALVMFFLLKDMGPALVMGFLFLAMFAVARNRAALALIGIAALVIGVAVGYHIGTPHTVVDRVSMWLSPWNNDVHGGDQLAHSLWAFATGGPLGSGPGWGDPSLIPAGHTDLVLPSIAEEWGLPGMVAIALLFCLLIHRAFRIALHAADEYGFFLAVALGTLISLEMLLISGGALGAIPLSGVASPFLSSGNSAMLANFFIFAILLAISNQSVASQAVAATAPLEDSDTLRFVFRVPVGVLSAVLALCLGALLWRCIYLQVLNDNELLTRDTFVFTQDGVKRPQHNPRLNLLAASIPRGTIYDRNGIPLAASNWDELEKHRADYQRLGINIDQACQRTDSRLYPFGPATIRFLGDWRTGENFHASNVSFIEHDSNLKLQGYHDYKDLGTVVRYRHQLANPALKALMSRDRTVTSTLDIRLQLKAAEVLRNHLAAAGTKGALVIMQPATGDVLAEVSWPEPPATGKGTPDEMLDRARYGEYPPGSTFKLVTAMAALRLNPDVTSKTYSCRRLPDGRVGTIIPGWRRLIRDDIKDHAHGTLDLRQAITVSCNAYFAQLGVYSVGEKALRETAGELGFSTGDETELKHMLPFAAYGQGPVLATPLKMARVAATVANGGMMAEGRWVSDSSNLRSDAPKQVLAPDSTLFLSNAMRSVVTSGTARAAMTGLPIMVAGKTGTAQLDSGEPHSWFAGFAPYDAPPDKRIAFAVVVEHGGYGALNAAPIARELVVAAQQLGIILEGSSETEVKDGNLERH